MYLEEIIEKHFSKETVIAGYRYARFFCRRSLFLCEYYSHYSCVWRDRSNGYMVSRKNAESW